MPRFHGIAPPLCTINIKDKFLINVVAMKSVTAKKSAIIIFFLLLLRYTSESHPLCNVNAEYSFLPSRLPDDESTAA